MEKINHWDIFPLQKVKDQRHNMELLPSLFLRQSGPSAREANNYETNVKVGTMQQKLDFKKGDHPAACAKYFTTSYVPKASDVAIL